MYRRARLRLTAWYSATILLVLVVLGLATYAGLVWALDREVDAGIRGAVDDWRATAPDLGPLAAIDPDRHADEDAEVFLLVFRADGALVANSSGFEADELLEQGFVRRALRGEDTWTTFDEHGRYRLRAAPLVQAGRITGAVIGGRSLEARDENVRLILTVLGVVAAAGFVLALVASYLLAGRAMRPLVDAHERERAFVGDASHELRSPLTLIRALAEVLQRGSLGDDQRRTVNQLVTVTDEASALVDDLLVLARAQEAGSTAGMTADLAVAAHEVAERMQPVLYAHQISLDEDLQPAAARIADSDARRIVNALLENVVAHTPAETRVRIRTRRTGGDALLSVSDSGPGVSDRELSRIFDRFTQIGAARTPGVGRGSGLGLAIVAAITSRWGGAAAARRADLGGLEVEVRLRAA
jgi:signal transduction histidine kinase